MLKQSISFNLRIYFIFFYMNVKLTTSVLFLIVIVSRLSLQAQVTLEKVYDFPGQRVASHRIIPYKSGFILPCLAADTSANNYHTLIIRTDGNGDTLWTYRNDSLLFKGSAFTSDSI